jgi:hypothetical protein
MGTDLLQPLQIDTAGVLDSGESLLWRGSPKQGLVLRSSDALMIPFSLLWGGFAIFWEWGVLNSGAPTFFALWGIPFVLVGLYMIIGRFFVDAKIRAGTAYFLTERRVVIVSGLFSRKIQSLPLRTLSELSVSERPDRTGTILFGRPGAYGAFTSGMPWPGMERYSTPSFELIPEAKRVHDRILEAQRAVA